MQGCKGCLDLIAQDLENCNDYRGHCRREITAQGGVEWHRTVRDYMPDGDDARVHYAPGDDPLCGTESTTAAYTDDPALVARCPDCLELAAEDLEEDNEHWANCLHCQQEISARNGVEWHRVVRAPCRPCALPSLREGRVVTNSRALRLALNKRPGARGSMCSPTWTASGSSSRV